jgi:hypothetical protein
VRSAGHAIEVIPCLDLVGGLSECFPVEDHIRVASDGQPPADRLGLAAGVLNDLERRIPPGQLVDARDYDLEIDAQLLEDLPPLGRARR